MKARRIPYSDEELAWLEANSLLPRDQLHAEFVKRFSRSDVSSDNIKGLCTRKGWLRRKPRAKISISDTELNWLCARKTMPRKELQALFCVRFNRTDISVKTLTSICSRKGWLTGRAKRRDNIFYRDKELSFVRKNRTLQRPDLHRKFQSKFGRKDVSVDNIKALCTRKGWKSGRDGKIKKGNIPPNKGKKGTCPAAARATQFKKGQIPKNAKPIGYERICPKNGYRMIKVARENPYTGAKTRIMPKHRYLWEEEHGEIPKDHVLRCLDGDVLNTHPENWVCVTLGVNARLNIAGFNEADPALRKTILAEHILRDKIGEHRPSAMQKSKQKGGYKSPSKAAEPAGNLRELIEETTFNFDCRIYTEEIDQAITAAWKGAAIKSDWEVPLPFLPDEALPNPIHIDWKRLRGRPDIRNRIAEVMDINNQETWRESRNGI